MDNEIRFLDFIFYSIIFFIVLLFLTIIIDIISSKIFPEERHKSILAEIFVMWILLSVILFYSKKIIFSIPNPFTDSTLTKINFDYTLIIILMPIIISCGIRNMRTKSQYLYDDIEHLFIK